MLLNFPVEITELILDELPDKKDLKHLCEVSKPLYQLVISRLYQTVTIEQDPHTQALIIEPFLRTCSRLTHCLQFVQNLKFIPPPVYDFFGQHCIHNRPLLEGVSDTEDQGIEPFVAPGIPISMFLDQLKDHHLRSFSWGLQTCVPSGIFKTGGYLAKRQNRIRSLSLVTDDYCQLGTAGGGVLDLTQLKHLRRLSWKKIRIDGETEEALRAWFRSDLELIESLELAFSDLSIENILQHDDDHDEYETQPHSFFFSRRVLGLNRGDRHSKLPSLKNLCFSRVWFTHLSSETAHFFNFSRLRSLKLRSCPDANSLLHAVVKRGIPIRLTTLEVATVFENHEEISALKHFLSSFRGLQFLYLDIHHVFKDFHENLQAIAEHRPTLRQLTYGHGNMDLDDICEDAGYGHPELSSTDPGFTQYLCDTVGLLANPILKEGKLECLGVCDSFVALRPIFAGSVGETLKVLHLRKPFTYGKLSNELHFFNQGWKIYNDMLHGQPDDFPYAMKDLQSNVSEIIHDASNTSGQGFDLDLGNWKTYRVALRDFAHWAFGPDGLPNLRFLLYGNLVDSAFADRSIVLSRTTPPETHLASVQYPRFRALEKSDSEMLDLRNKYSDFLTALPSG